MNQQQPQPHYIPQMASVVERINNPPKLVQAIQCFNEEEFIGLTLASIYDQVDKILVIEGAVGEREDATENGHSTDKTVEIIKDFKENHDPDSKVMLISIKRPWESLEEMKQTFLDLTSPGDWLIINDADEFYRPEDIRRVRAAIDRHPHATEIVPAFLHFYRDRQHIAVPGPEWQPSHQRVLKNMGGMKYNSHPVATMADGYCSYFTGFMQPRRFMMHDFFVYHYGYARANMDNVMQKKKAYYEKELAKHDGANDKFNKKAQDWFDGTEPVLFYDGDHPAVIGEERVLPKGEAPWDNDPFYKIILTRQPIPNIWLCMTQQAQPFMHFYSNMVDEDI